MAEEIVVQVDSRNRRPRPVSRPRVVSERLFHRGIVVFVLNSKGKIFLQRRSERKRVYGGFWDGSCAGTVGWGETYAECAVRELGEELTFHVASRQLKRVGAPYRVSTDETNEFDQLFTVASEGQFSLQRGEVSEGRWVPLKDVGGFLRDEKVTPWFSLGWDLFRKTMRNSRTKPK